MKRGNGLLIAGVLVIAGVAILVATAALTPEGTHPAFATALAFATAAGRGDETEAFALLSPEMQAFARASCPEGQVTRCVAGYTPPEWGAFQSVVFRRAAPDMATAQAGEPRAYDVDLIATYAEGRGFSGVCIYQRMAQDTTGAWRVAGYAGYVSCGDPESREMASNPDAPNRAP